jgi:hypothetical protein
MEHIFFIPVRTSTAGALAVRTGRLGSGERVGLAFTSEESLTRALGPSQQWIHLALEALADMLAPLGIEHITVDPGLVGASCTDGPGQQPRLTPPGRRQPAAAAA